MPSDLPMRSFRSTEGLRVWVRFVDENGAILDQDQVRAAHVTGSARAPG